MVLNELNYMVAGAGKSGIGALCLLKNAGANVFLYDGNKDLSLDELKSRMKEQGIENPEDIEVVLGELTKEKAETIDVCVISPGISLEVPFVVLLKELNKTIWGEIELAYRCGKGRVVGITGTNGKTTTTALMGAIMKKAAKSEYTVGNIGTPYTLMADKTDEDSVTVAEISSFQLETIDTFHPNVSAVLNITPDHLNRHHTMECYADVKMSISKNQTSDEVCVLNYEDEYLPELSKKINARPVFFSSKRELENGVFCDANGDIFMAVDGKKEFIINKTQMKLVGMHNVENVMAAIAMADALGVEKEVYLDVIKNFEAVEHRIEFVENINDVIYYNDSKGTNTDASIKALEAMDRPTILIAGGYDKGSTYDDWVEAFGDKVKCLVLLGKTKDAIAETAKKHGFYNIIMTESLKEAVEVCFREANPGDAVLLSPACASWDMFKSYEERGKLFKEYVRALK